MSINAQVGQWAPAIPSTYAQGLPKVAVDPQAISDLGLTSGPLTFKVNLTDAPSIKSFKVIIRYNFAVLDAIDATGVDFSGNVFVAAGLNPSIFAKCVDGLGTNCTFDDGPGVVTAALFLIGEGQKTPAPTNGLLFQLTFNVVGLGFSQLELFQVVVVSGQSQVEVITFDGYFNNVDCPRGSGTLCTPPVPDFTFSPPVPVQGRVIRFNASSSQPGPGTTIVEYFWNWGDGTNPEPPTTNPVTTHIFATGRTYQVTLKVTDSNDIRWAKTRFVSVINILIDMTIGDLTSTRNHRVLPGTILTITADLRNAGIKPENASLEIILKVGDQNLSLGQSQFFNMDPQAEQSLTVTWNTTGYDPRVYRIDAVTPTVTNSTTREKIENNTDNNVKSTYIQLIEPLPAGLGLGLLETTGLGVVLLSGAGFAVSRLRRKPTLEAIASDTLGT